MRSLAFILSILVLALSCMPCADAAAFHDKAKQEITQASDHDADHMDICSPFCLCTCCAAVSIHHPLSKVTFLIPGRAFQYSSRYIAAFNEVSLPIWQPPQLI